MQSTPLPPPLPLGELVLRTGRLNGTRRPLTLPLTLIGRAAGCDIRLNVDAIAPHHCAVVHTPGGFVLRDLGSANGTLVNGAKALTRPLGHGDRLDIGPFQFEVHLPDSGKPPPGPDGERDALRIQAAAVVAQQAALSEEESKLTERRSALERQEEQLSAHLDENRRQLLDLREQVRTEREQWKADRAVQEQHIATRHDESKRAINEAEQEWDRAKKERARCAELLRRLKRRWEERFTAHEVTLKRREQELDTRWAALTETVRNLERDHEAVVESRRQHNGAMELERRELAQAWEDLTRNREQVQTTLQRDKAALEKRSQQLAERERAVGLQDKQLADERRSWEQTQSKLRKDADGLESRIQNHRLKLDNLERTLAAGAAHSPAPLPEFSLSVSVPVGVDVAQSEQAEAPLALRRLAGCLADQRLRLLEQWRALVDVQDLWQRQRDDILSEMEESGRRQTEREADLLAREAELALRKAELDQRQRAATDTAAALESRHAQLTANVLEWEAERTHLLDMVHDRERAANRRVHRLLAVSRRAVQRQRAEVANLKSIIEQYAEARQHYLAAWNECRERGEALLREQQAATSESLALEQLRLEMLSKADDAAAAEKRLDKLRRQGQGIAERAQLALEGERVELRTEAARLEQRDQTLRKDETSVLAWKRQLAKRHLVLDRRRVALQQEAEERATELDRLRAQHETDRKQLQSLRDEVERVARLLMEDSNDPPSAQAA